MSITIQDIFKTILVPFGLLTLSLEIKRWLACHIAGPSGSRKINVG